MSRGVVILDRVVIYVWARNKEEPGTPVSLPVGNLLAVVAVYSLSVN
jgi:hypothetical protein